MRIKERLKKTLIGLLALNFIVLIHELGHFIFCKLFQVSTPVFSIGFDPKLISYKLGQTTFQLGLIPIGGYVSINSLELNLLPFKKHLLILFAGILFNLLLSLFLFLYLFAKSKRGSLVYLKNENDLNQSLSFVGIINLLGSAFSLNLDKFLYFVSLVSLNIAIFNLLPIPFLDGGQIFLLISEKIFGPIYFNEKFSNIFYYIIIVLFFLFNLSLFKRDISKLKDS